MTMTRELFDILFPAVMFMLPMSAAERRGFINQADRDYFAKPVQVTWVYSTIGERFAYVRDDARGGIVFPTDRRRLVPEYRLSIKQRAAAGLPKLPRRKVAA